MARFVHQNIAVITPLINSRFLELVLRAPLIQQLANDAIKDTAIPDLQLGFLSRFPIALPPDAEQHEIVRRVDALFAVADEIEARYEKARRHVDRLTQCVLAKAFRGELVPTEHALADRIRTAQPAAAPRRRSTSRRRSRPAAN